MLFTFTFAYNAFLETAGTVSGFVAIVPGFSVVSSAGLSSFSTLPFSPMYLIIPGNTIFLFLIASFHTSVFGIFKTAFFPHLENALDATSGTFDPLIVISRFLQYTNACFSIDVTDSGIVTFFSFVA